MLLLLALSAVSILVVVGGIAVYNGIVRLRNQVDNGWAQIDVQLNRRNDLIPNLIETVKGYAAHESQTLQAVIAARQAGVAANTPAAAAAAASSRDELRR